MSTETDNQDPYFEIDGTRYRKEPSLDEFIDDAGFDKASAHSRIAKAFDKADISDVSALMYKTEKEFADMEGISAPAAKALIAHIVRLRNQGSLVASMEEVIKKEGNYSYLGSGSGSLDRMMTYSNGQTGWRSKTLIELYGEPSMGKTQICYTACSLVMAPPERGGWGRGMAYIDSEGAFVFNRFKFVAQYWGVDMEASEDKFLYSRVTNFDEVEMAIDDIVKVAKERDIGILIVDSIMDPLKSQYPVGGQELSNLQPRQKHLKRVLDKLKNFAINFNAIVMYTNHVRSNIGAQMGTPELGAQGGAVLGHASDIRILLEKGPKANRTKFVDESTYKTLPIKFQRAKIVDCGFLPEESGFFLQGAMGIADPDNWTLISKQVAQFQKDGYISTDNLGNPIENPLTDDKSPDERIKEHYAKVYGSSKSIKREVKKTVKAKT